MFKAPRPTNELVLATGRVLPSSADIEAFLNNPQLGAADEPFLGMAIDHLRQLYFIASNQNGWRDQADLYFYAINYLEGIK